MKGSEKNENGYLILEAALVYPIIIVLLVMFLYIILIFAQRAQMYNAAEQTIVYIKDACSSNYDMSKFTIGENGLPSLNTEAGTYNVYTNLFNTTNKQVKQLVDGGHVDKIYRYFMGTPLLANGTLTVDAVPKSKFICTEVIVTAEYRWKSPINFSFVGGGALNNDGDGTKLSVSVRGVIQDNVETIRTLSYVRYVWTRSGLADKFNSVIGKVKSWIGPKGK